MKIRELIEKLQVLNPEAEIYVLYDGAHAACGVSDVIVSGDTWPLDEGDIAIRTDQ